MQTIATNKVNDIYLNKANNLEISTDAIALANVAKNTALTQYGEPEFNQEIGIPYLTTIFTDTPLLDIFQAATTFELANVENVIRVKNFDYKIEKDIFKYTVDLETTYGEITLNG